MYLWTDFHLALLIYLGTTDFEVHPLVYRAFRSAKMIGGLKNRLRNRVEELRHCEVGELEDGGGER